MIRKPLILIIMDGWGLNPKKFGNAIALADTPNFDRLKADYPYTTLKAAGIAVGLPPNEMGNSETGHLNIGAGRIVIQDQVRIDKAINNKSFYENKAFLKAIQNVKKNKSTLHIMGLLQDQGVHAHQNHLFALLKLAARQKLTDVMIHVFTDGRDTGPMSAKRYIKQLNDQIKKNKVGKIATVIGRYYSMDRDTRWDRIELAYNGLVKAEGKRAKTAVKGIDDAYKAGETDEFMKPIIVGDFTGTKNQRFLGTKNQRFLGIKDNDSVIFFNYRLDRARQLTHAFTDKVFKRFKRKKVNTCFVCMTRYYPDVKALIAFEPANMRNILGEVLSKKGLKQLRMAETEKYAHVTFFFNGLIEKPFKGEDGILVPSPRIATYDLKPEMSAYEMTERVLKEIAANKYDVIIINYANGDMIGHTGKLEAAIIAVETVDECVGRVVKAILAKEGIALVTADHGNADEMMDPRTKQPITSHTTNPVPFILVSEKRYRLKKGILADIAPTMLELLNIKKPKEMTGESLIRK